MGPNRCLVGLTLLTVLFAGCRRSVNLRDVTQSLNPNPANPTSTPYTSPTTSTSTSSQTSTSTSTGTSSSTGSSTSTSTSTSSSSGTGSTTGTGTQSTQQGPPPVTLSNIQATDFDAIQFTVNGLTAGNTLIIRQSIENGAFNPASGTLNGTNCSLSGLNPLTSYTYAAVQCLPATGVCSVASNQVTEITPPRFVDNLGMPYLNSAQEEISWTYPTTQAATGFAVERQRGATWVRLAVVLPNATGNYLYGDYDSNLKRGVPHTYRVLAQGRGKESRSGTVTGNYLADSAKKRWLIAALYGEKETLNRKPDAGGLASWLALLDGGSTQSSLVAAVQGSVEAREKLVHRFYWRFLGRAADAVGLPAYRDLLGAGLTREAFAQALLASDEYRNKAQTRVGVIGDTPLRRWVSSLYLDLLGRPGSAAEVNGWANLISQGYTYTQIAAGIQGSPEALGNRVDELYQDILNRAADPGGRAAWVQALQGGLGEAALIRAFLSSAEYFDGI